MVRLLFDNELQRLSLSDSRVDIAQKIAAAFMGRSHIIIENTRHSMAATLLEKGKYDTCFYHRILIATFDDDDKCLMINIINNDLAKFTGVEVDGVFYPLDDTLIEVLKTTPDYDLCYMCPYTQETERDLKKACNFWEQTDCRTCDSRSSLEYSGTFSDDTNIRYLYEQSWITATGKSRQTELYNKYGPNPSHRELYDMDEGSYCDLEDDFCCESVDEAGYGL